MHVILKCNLFLWRKAEFSASLLRVSVTWSFSNHSDMLICCSRKTATLYFCRKTYSGHFWSMQYQTLNYTHFFKQVLIFSQMTSILDILMDYCYLRGYEYSRLDGSMSYTDRDENVSSSLLVKANSHHLTVSKLFSLKFLCIFSCRWRSFLLIRRCSSSSWALELVVLGSTSQLPTRSSYLTVTGYEFCCATRSYVTCIEPHTWHADKIFIMAMKFKNLLHHFS